jgi:hypothetical protein
MRGLVRAKEVAAALQISQPSVSRLIRSAGERIHRIGRGPSTRYVLVRSIPRLNSSLAVFQVDERGQIRLYATLYLLAQKDRYWLEKVTGTGQHFSGLPPFVWDISPQGYLGRSFSSRYAELGLPQRIRDWSDDDRLVALARRGEDCVGNFIIGEESANRFLGNLPQAVQRNDYPAIARASLSGPVGSSAGGEQPKIAVYSEGRHVIVKFAENTLGPAAARWRDLLVCENAALHVIRNAGIQAAVSSWFDCGDFRFLEVERFDRVGLRGRRRVISLFALDLQYHGQNDNWTKAAQRLLTEPNVRIDPEDVRQVRWLDTFGELIGNTDRHYGNISFYEEEQDDAVTLRLAPIYDMLPMIFAPDGPSVVERQFAPRPPTVDNLDVWRNAAETALAYWSALADSAELSDGFREICSRCREAVKTLLKNHLVPE